jgi:hypothetical protein
VHLIAEGRADHDGAAGPKFRRGADHIDAGTVWQAKIDNQHVGRRSL